MSSPSLDEKTIAVETKQPVQPNNPQVLATTTASNGDAALKLLQETGGFRQPLDPETNRRLLRKIDLHIMPLICIVYFLQYIDKTAISYASVTGIFESVNLVGNQFNWVASIFFFGYVDAAHG